MIRLDSYSQWTGRNRAADGKATFDEALQNYARIREQLAGQAYLLDIWLTGWLEAANAVTAFSAVEKGQQAAVELRSLCRDLLTGHEADTAHPFYEQVKTYTAEHPLQYRELYTRMSVCFCRLAFDFLNGAAPRFQAEQQKAVREVLDLVDHESQYRQICRELNGEDAMCALLASLRRCFLSADPMLCFYHGFANELLNELTMQDRETGKTVAQLLNG